jgi:hypothetical protein
MNESVDNSVEKSSRLWRNYSKQFRLCPNELGLKPNTGGNQKTRLIFFLYFVFVLNWLLFLRVIVSRGTIYLIMVFWLSHGASVEVTGKDGNVSRGTQCETCAIAATILPSDRFVSKLCKCCV